VAGTLRNVGWAAWTDISAQSMSGLLGSLTLALRELIDGVAGGCHDDSSPRSTYAV